MMVIKLILLFQENAFHLFLESLILEPDANHPTGHGEGGGKQNKKTRKNDKNNSPSDVVPAFVS